MAPTRREAWRLAAGRRGWFNPGGRTTQSHALHISPLRSRRPSATRAWAAACHPSRRSSIHSSRMGSFSRDSTSRWHSWRSTGVRCRNGAYDLFRAKIARAIGTEVRAGHALRTTPARCTHRRSRSPADTGEVQGKGGHLRSGISGEDGGSRRGSREGVARQGPPGQLRRYRVGEGREGCIQSALRRCTR